MAKSRARPPRGPAAAPSIDVLVENLPGNLYRRVRRPDGGYHFEYLSSGLFRQFDIDHEALLAQGSIRFDWIHSEDRARFVADLEISAATLGLLDHRVRVLGRDGRAHWARGIARPSRRADGSVVWDGIVIDVTREVEAESALRVAKEEADRAHATAAAFVADAVRRLDGPVRRLGEALERAPSGPRAAELRACHRRLRAALGDLGARAGAPSPAGGNGAGAGAGAHPREPALTPRQREVLALVREGQSNKGVAARLGITPGTVKLHVAAGLRALGLRTRRELRASDAA